METQGISRDASLSKKASKTPFNDFLPNLGWPYIEASWLRAWHSTGWDSFKSP